MTGNDRLTRFCRLGPQRFPKPFSKRCAENVPAGRHWLPFLGKGERVLQLLAPRARREDIVEGNGKIEFNVLPSEGRSEARLGIGNERPQRMFPINRAPIVLFKGIMQLGCEQRARIGVGRQDVKRRRRSEHMLLQRRSLLQIGAAADGRL